MKTTVEIPDTLLLNAKRLALKQNSSLREIIVQGLKLILDQSKSSTFKFKLSDKSVEGKGIRPEFESGWSSIRDAIYPISEKLK